MNLSFNAEEEAFRQEVRAFFESELPEDLRQNKLQKHRFSAEGLTRWHKILFNKGWIAPDWPEKFGGTGWTVTQQYIFDEERAAAGAPSTLPFSLKMVAPVIMAFGNQQQQEFFLPRILRGEDWWCQGYSEPGAGSDLASLKTKAERVGDNYIVNGQKTWTTLGQFADWIFCLVRTDPDAKKQRGISFLLIDMKTPGITVRPIIMLDGEHEVNEVFFDNVEVPVENLVGEENKGWTYAKYLLGHERTNIAGVAESKLELHRLKGFAAKADDGGRPLIENPRFADKVAKLEIELMALEITNLRVLAANSERPAPGPEASLLKIKGSEIQQWLTELQMETAGYYGMPYQPNAHDAAWDGFVAGPEESVPHAGQYFNMRKTTIYGGSNEIQKNIVFGMMAAAAGA